MKKLLGLTCAAMLPDHVGGERRDRAPVSMKGPGAGNPFWAAVEAGAKEKAAELGVDLVVLAPPQESDIQSQISQVEDQLAKKIDALAIAPTDPNALAPIVDQAKAAGVGVVFVDTKGINEGVTFIGTNNEVGAALAADFICKNIPAGREGRDPSGHHHPVDRPGPRRRRQEGPDRLRPQRRRRAAGRLGYRQGPGRDGEHPHRQPGPQGGLRLERQHGARRGRGAQVGQHARQGHGGRLRRQPQRRGSRSSPAR